MVKTSELIAYVQTFLNVDQFADYCPNGLQVAGADELSVLVSGVTASQAFLDAAVSKKADAVLVHHGYFWKNEPITITGMKRRRIATLIQHNMNLLAYHLPLDAHPDVGNNAQLAHQLGITIEGTFELEPKLPLGFVGELTQTMSGAEFAAHIATQLQRTPLHVPGRAETIKRVAWCTGAAQNYVLAAWQQNVDAYITGEVSESTAHVARENGIHFYAAGHHATERYGAKALGEHLAQRFSLEHHFIDIDNPA